MTALHTEFVPRIAHLEQDVELDPKTGSLLKPTCPRFRWACDHCRSYRRFFHGKWTGEDDANDQADAHDRIHASERQWEREEAARRTATCHP